MRRSGNGGYMISAARAPPTWPSWGSRRTSSTLWLNHINGHKAGVAGIYKRAEHSAERKAALELWAARVEALVTGPSAKVLAFNGVR